MAITSYDELLTAVENWLARTDLTDRIPEFIALAEAKFNRDLSVRQMEQRSTTTADADSTSPEFISLPTDFRSMRWVRLSSVTGKPHLNYLSPVQMTERRYASGNSTGQPAYFTILASDIELCPTPDQDYTIEMVYRKFLTPLSDDETSNWLLELAPDLYLYGALVEASAFIGNDERIAVWGQGYQRAVDALNGLHFESGFNAGPLVMTATGVTP